MSLLEKHFSLRARLARINLRMLAVAIAFVSVAVLFAAAGVGFHRSLEDGRRHVSHLNEQLATGLSANDQVAVSAAFASLRTLHDVTAVVLLRQDRSVFFSDEKSAGESSSIPALIHLPAGYKFGWSKLDFMAPAQLGGQQVGWIGLSLDLEDFYHELLLYLALILVSFVIALLLALRLQARELDRLIAPLQEFTRCMTQASTGHPDIRAMATGFPSSMSWPMASTACWSRFRSAITGWRPILVAWSNWSNSGRVNCGMPRTQPRRVVVQKANFWQR